jgi:hypothetical protein
LLSKAVRPWIHGEGLSYQLNYAWDELETVRRLVPGVEGIAAYRHALQSLTKESNEELFKLVEDSSIAFEAGDRSVDADAVQRYCEANAARLIALRNRFIADNIYLLRDASQLDAAAAGPVIAPQVH